MAIVSSSLLMQMTALDVRYALGITPMRVTSGGPIFVT